jgi:hypothetical protein
LPILLAVAFSKMGPPNSNRVVLALPLLALVLGTTYLSAAQTNLNLPYNVATTSQIYGPYEAMQYFQKDPCNCPVYMADDWKAGQLLLKGIPGIKPEPVEPDPYLTQSDFNVTDRPTQFFLLGTGPLFNGSRIASSMGDIPQPFVNQTYASLMNGSSSTKCYTVSAKLVFSTATANLVEGSASWTC